MQIISDVSAGAASSHMILLMLVTYHVLKLISISSNQNDYPDMVPSADAMQI